MSDANPELIVERDGSILVLTMNRPHRRNAFGPEMLVRMSDAWVELSEDPDLRVGIVTGADGNFSSGADLKAMAEMGSGSAEWADRVKSDADLAWRALLRHYRPTKPLIAAVEGYAIAGGTEILQAMDIRVAAETATFGIAEVRRGLFPLGGSTVRLRRQIPYTVAADLLLTGRFISAPLGSTAAMQSPFFRPTARSPCTTRLQAESISPRLHSRPLGTTRARAAGS